MAEGKPPLTAELVWSDHLQFDATSGASSVIVDGDGLAGPSPMQLAAFALAGCMAADVVAILVKGRHALAALRASLTAERASDPPRRFVRLTLMLHVSGAVPPQAVSRAIELSRERYCSVWHSFRQDIDLTVDYEVHA